MDREDSYRPEDRVKYKEGGTVLDVNVLQNNCDEDDIAYFLVLVDNLTLNSGMERGHRFNCRKPRKGGFVGNWHLSKDLVVR